MPVGVPLALGRSKVGGSALAVLPPLGRCGGEPQTIGHRNNHKRGAVGQLFVRRRAYSGSSTTSWAALAPQRAHFRRRLILAISPDPHLCTTSNPLSVLAAAQRPHSMRRLHPKRTRSAAVPMCLYDIGGV